MVSSLYQDNLFDAGPFRDGQEVITMTMPGIWELLIIALIVLLIFGSNRLMGIMRDMGKEVYKLKDKIKDIENITKNGMK